MKKHSHKMNKGAYEQIKQIPKDCDIVQILPEKF